LGRRATKKSCILDNRGVLHPCSFCLGQVCGQVTYQLVYSQLNVYSVIIIGDSEPRHPEAVFR